LEDIKMSRAGRLFLNMVVGGAAGAAIYLGIIFHTPIVSVIGVIAALFAFFFI
jgi:hypothetical protein